MIISRMLKLTNYKGRDNLYIYNRVDSRLPIRKLVLNTPT